MRVSLWESFRVEQKGHGVLMGWDVAWIKALFDQSCPEAMYSRLNKSYTGKVRPSQLELA